MLITPCLQISKSSNFCNQVPGFLVLLTDFFYEQLYAVVLPIIIFIFVYLRRRDIYDLHHSILGNFRFSVIFPVVQIEISSRSEFCL